jgi:hypothetical protein
MEPESKRGFAYLSRDLMLEIWPLLRDDERALLPVLMTHFPNIKPAVATLARRLGKSCSSIQRTTRSLANAGLLVRVRSSSGGRFTDTNEWRMAEWDEPGVRAALVVSLTGRIGATGSGDATGSVGDAGSVDAGAGVAPVRPQPSHGCDPSPRVDATQRMRREGREETGEGKEEIAAAPLAGCAGTPAESPLGVAGEEPGGEAVEAVAPGLPGEVSPVVMPGEGVVCSPAVAQPLAGQVPGAKGQPAARKGRAGKPAGLSDDQKRIVSSSMTAMIGYWRFGAGAVGKAVEDWSGLASQPTDWAPRGPDFRLPEPDVGVPALAAWYWTRACRVRAQLGQPIGLPAFPKLCGVVKQLRERMTQEDLVQLVVAMTDGWASIQSSLGWMSSPPPLDELTLQDRRVMDAAKTLAAGGNLKPAGVRQPVPVSSHNEKLIEERYADVF